MENILLPSKRRISVVGAGPAGCAVARICAEAGCEVRVYERRGHVGGNTFDEKDEYGVRLHRYGPHYFRTNNAELLDWLSSFTEWIPGRYYVRSSVNGTLVPMPVSLATMSALKGEVFTADKFENYLAEWRESVDHPMNAEEQCLTLVGRELYELLFKGYTIKQWDRHPTELDASITARIPIRFNWDERYPVEPFQVMPADGYTAMYRNMLHHPSICVELNAELSNADIASERRSSDATIYTGQIDSLFEYRYGRLPYRSLRFEWKHYDERFVQPVVQINYPNEYEYTRTVEIKHATGQSIQTTTVCYEYPVDTGEPFYPVLSTESKATFERYRSDAEREEKIDGPLYLVGRLAEYRYYNMDQVLLRAIQTAKQIIKGWTL
jgi:UDP-galactopyranose mutase